MSPSKTKKIKIDAKKGDYTVYFDEVLDSNGKSTGQGSCNQTKGVSMKVSKKIKLFTKIKTILLFSGIEKQWENTCPNITH
jgi:hypothetical protein